MCTVRSLARLLCVDLSHANARPSSPDELGHEFGDAVGVAEPGAVPGCEQLEVCVWDGPGGGTRNRSVSERIVVAPEQQRRDGKLSQLVGWNASTGAPAVGRSDRADLAAIRCGGHWVVVTSDQQVHQLGMIDDRRPLASDQARELHD
jgi:hypothetical protein